jgi:putative ABC transport system permease protein
MSSLRLADVLEGLRHVARHPLRSALTAVTCAVAIAVTVNVISLNYGLDEDIRRDIAKFGRLTIDVGRAPLIRPGTPRATFGEADLARIRATVADLGAVVVPLRTEAGVARGDVEARRLVLAAVSPEYPRTLQVDLVAGRWFTDAERGLSACVLDRSAAAALFPGVPPAGVVGRRIALGREPSAQPVVVGVLGDPMTHRAVFEAFDEGRSSRTLVGALLSFRNVYVPQDALASGELTMVHVVLADEARLDEARRRLEAIWPASDLDLAADRIAPVTVFTRRTWIDAFGGTTQAGAFLGNLVWVLIVLVACVMITTLNLITIRERYDEVAVRRCEGARKAHLVVQVTAEGLATSVVGGLLGLPLGYAGAEALRRIVDFPFRFDPRYAVAAMAVSAALGLLSSVLPARRAAGLDPARVLSRRLT